MDLAKLPVTSSDFASACMTARVPRSALRLLVVRIISTLPPDGTVIDESGCRSAGCLIDNRHTMSGLCAAIQSTVECAVSSVSAPIHAFVRDANGDLHELSRAETGRTIEEEMAMTDGLLQPGTRVSGALRAWQDHCSVRSATCIRAVVGMQPDKTIVNETHRMLASGIMKLTGGGRPTTTVPEACACTELPSCDCFTRRAMYRAGTVWLVVYAALPPNRRKWERNANLQRIPEWVSHFVDGTASESICETPIHPTTWPVEMPLIMPFCWDECSSDETLSASESGQAVQLCPLAILPPSGLLELAVFWALKQPKTRMIHGLAETARQIGPYYGPALKCVLAKAGSSSWPGKLLQRAKALDADCASETLYQMLRLCENGAEAVVSVYRRISPAKITSLEGCATTGFSLAAISLAVACIEEHVFACQGQEIDRLTRAIRGI